MKNFALQEAQYIPTNKCYTQSQDFKFKCWILIFKISDPVGFFRSVWAALSNPEKMELDISGSLDKSITPGNYMFPPANLHNGSILDYVPDDNIVNDSKKLCIR
jgi:hypothetical protein